LVRENFFVRPPKLGAGASPMSEVL